MQNFVRKTAIKILGTRKGHIHKYEAVLWTLRKSKKVTFCYKIINFSF